MSWPKISIDGRECNLCHLDPIVLNVTPKAEGAPTFRVRVSFGCHTFTRDLQDDDPEDHHFRHDGEERCLCPQRYALSKRLPELITADIGRVYFSYDGYLLGYELDGLASPYAVVFKLSKAKASGFDVAMFVVTAHEKAVMPARAPAITFATLISKTATGKRVTRPSERNTSWIKK